MSIARALVIGLVLTVMVPVALFVSCAVFTGLASGAYDAQHGR